MIVELDTLILCAAIAYTLGVVAGAYVVWRFWLVPEQLAHYITSRLHHRWRDAFNRLSIDRRIK